MVIAGYRWLWVVIHGYTWLLVVIDGYRWLWVVIGGYRWLCYSYTTSCCGLSGIHEAGIELEAEAKPRLLIQ